MTWTEEKLLIKRIEELEKNVANLDEAISAIKKKLE